ncbi:MAG: hypothetical protein A3F42_03945 [Gammaproteobacteria bacterium RIFCSPHIGHO2_12_FULL_37_34]|nr:MAG: hypothetical protein A3F42_03945 [Gammaproteobacteria bacterium RIFCSPHIGHO2_12_FULL_37_34]
MTHDDPEQKNKLLELIRSALQRESDLREKYKIGDKFRFIRDCLQALLSKVEEHAKAKQVTAQTENKISPDEILVYVYLYNAQGNMLKSWVTMLNPNVFYEYSVNRPIYAEKSYIEAWIRSRPNKAQHAYLTISIKAHDRIQHPELESLKDILGHPLIKVKEGALHVDKLISLTYGEKDYRLNENGELEILKKSSLSF